jgi:hypothetical protein
MSGYNAYQYANQVPYNYLSTSPAYIYTQPQFQPQVPQQTQQSQQGGINWVQGEAGAKSFVVGAGQSVMLMDSENSVFYIKSTDASGMPLPLRIFDYSERTQNNNPISNPVENIQDKYVTKEEFENALNNINVLIQQMAVSKVNTNTRKKGNGNNDESPVQSFK